MCAAGDARQAVCMAAACSHSAVTTCGRWTERELEALEDRGQAGSEPTARKLGAGLRLHALGAPPFLNCSQFVSMQSRLFVRKALEHTFQTFICHRHAFTRFGVHDAGTALRCARVGGGQVGVIGRTRQGEKAAGHGNASSQPSMDDGRATVDAVWFSSRAQWCSGARQEAGREGTNSGWRLVAWLRARERGAPSARGCCRRGHVLPTVTAISKQGSAGAVAQGGPFSAGTGAGWRVGQSKAAAAPNAAEAKQAKAHRRVIADGAQRQGPHPTPKV